MRKIGIFSLIFFSCMLGVLAAFQIDHYMNRPKVEKTSFDALHTVTPVSFDTAQPGPVDFRSAAKKIMPSVVSVDRRERVRDIFTDTVQVIPSGTGSGVVISSDGYVLTNNHVVSGADYVQVRLVDQRSFPAKVIGTDPRSDIAVIKINAKDLTPAEIGDSDKLEVGQWVIAVGNPLGYSNTVSVGVVSSLKRTLAAGESGTLLIDTIQTDAAINGGNSGGALSDAGGRVVGINSAIASNNGGSIGIGFSIPINRAKRAVDDILKYGHVRYGSPGFDVYQASLQDARIREDIQQALGAAPPSNGLIVNNVDPTGPAGKAGIKRLDIVVSVDGAAVSDPTEFVKMFADKRPGDSVAIKVWSSGKTETKKLLLQDLQSF